jgi:hypothetical protein
VTQSEPAPDVPSWTANAVLIYGPRKAGTTLLLNLLDGSDAMLAFPAEIKTKIFQRWTREQTTRDNYVAESRVPDLAQDGVSLDIYRARWRGVDPASVAGRLDLLLRLDAWHMYQAASHPPAAPKLWCAKDVGGRTDRIVALWRRCFPASRIVFILRDPRQVTRAVMNDRRRKGTRLPFWKIARETADPMRVVATQARYLDDPRVLALAYEDLVTDTKRTVQRIADFLEIPFEDVLLRPTMFGRPVVVSTSSQNTTEVFRSETSWSAGLPFREQFWIRLASLVLRWHPTFRIDYPTIRRKIASLGEARERPGRS